jgi:diamine N-acetyltransferase
VLLAAAGDRLVGFVQFGAARGGAGPSDQELRRIYVHRELQSQGHGTSLMERALDHPQLRSAERIQLDVWEHNHGAQRFYARYGFRVAGSRRFETASGATPGLDLVMVRTRPERL